MDTHFHEIIFHIEAFLYFLFALSLITYKKGNWLANRLFAAFLFSKTLISINVLSYYYRHILYHACIIMYIFTASFSFLFAPLLFLYARSVLYGDFKLKTIHLIHAVPFLLDVVFQGVLYVTLPDIQDILIEWGSLIPQSISPFHSLINDIQVFTYLLTAMFMVRGYTFEVKKYHSSFHKIHLSWLKLLLLGFITIHSFYIYKHISIILIGEYAGSLTIWMHLASLIIVTIIFYHCIVHPEIFSEIKHKPKYIKSSLSESDKEEYMKKLQSFMESEKPYLAPNVTLFELAKKIGIPPHHLSQILNTRLNQNFFDFINAYRIKESKRLISDPNNVKRTILEILYETGFNSKSVFNIAFKKHTGMTPTQFRKSKSS